MQGWGGRGAGRLGQNTEWGGVEEAGGEGRQAQKVHVVMYVPWGELYTHPRHMPCCLNTLQAGRTNHLSHPVPMSMSQNQQVRGLERRWGRKNCPMPRPSSSPPQPHPFLGMRRDNYDWGCIFVLGPGKAARDSMSTGRTGVGEVVGGGVLQPACLPQVVVGRYRSSFLSLFFSLPLSITKTQEPSSFCFV